MYTRRREMAWICDKFQKIIVAAATYVASNEIQKATIFFVDFV